LVDRGLTQNFNTKDLVKFLEKKSKTSHLKCNHIEGDIMQNHVLKRKVKKTKILWAKQTYFLAPCPLVLGQF
jgi:hypothetical protein